MSELLQARKVIVTTARNSQRALSYIWSENLSVKSQR